MTTYVTKYKGYPIRDAEAREQLNSQSEQLNNIANELGRNTDGTEIALDTEAQNVREAINEVFQSASNGKQAIANAITGKGIDASNTDTFTQLAEKISQISTGTTSIDGLIITIDGIKYTLSEDAEGNITATKVKHTVTNNLTNATNSNSVTEVEDNTYYSANISANTGYKLNSVVVTMGGTDVTSSAYSNGNINISNVTGNIVITVTTEIDTDSIVGSIDSNNVISLTGLASGTYTLKYEDSNGNVLDDFSTITTMEVI